MNHQDENSIRGGDFPRGNEPKDSPARDEGERTNEGGVADLIEWLEREAARNDDYAVDQDENAEEWAANPDPFKAGRAIHSRAAADRCREDAARFRRWIAALSPAQTGGTADPFYEVSDERLPGMRYVEPGWLARSLAAEDDDASEDA